MLFRLLVWTHVVAACFWVGGILFFALVLVPALRRSGSPQVALLQLIGRRFRAWGWASVAVLVLTGLGNVLYRVPATELLHGELWSSPWGQILALKLGLVASVIAVSFAHDVLGTRAVQAAKRDGASREAARLRSWASMLGRLDGVLVLAVLFVAVVLVRGW
jgi:copper resistance protein D